MKKWYLFVNVVAVFFLLGASCTITKTTPPELLFETPPQMTVQNETTQPTATTKNTESTQTTQVSQEAVRCSTMDCLIQLAETCTQGDIIYIYSMPFPLSPNSGITINSKTYYKINGKNAGGTCIFVYKPLGGSMALSAEGKKEALAKGQTEKEINDQMKIMSDSLNDPNILNTITTCKGTEMNIAKYLTNTKNGSFTGSCVIVFGKKETSCTVEPNLSCITKTL